MELKAKRNENNNFEFRIKSLRRMRIRNQNFRRGRQVRSIELVQNRCVGTRSTSFGRHTESRRNHAITVQSVYFTIKRRLTSTVLGIFPHRMEFCVL